MLIGLPVCLPSKDIDWSIRSALFVLLLSLPSPPKTTPEQILQSIDLLSSLCACKVKIIQEVSPFLRLLLPLKADQSLSQPFLLLLLACKVHARESESDQEWRRVLVLFHIPLDLIACHWLVDAVARTIKGPHRTRGFWRLAWTTTTRLAPYLVFVQHGEKKKKRYTHRIPARIQGRCVLHHTANTSTGKGRFVPCRID